MSPIIKEIHKVNQIDCPFMKYEAAQKLSPRARAVYRAMHCTASDFKQNLDSCEDQDLDLLPSFAAHSAVKTKLLTSRIRRAAK